MPHPMKNIPSARFVAHRIRRARLSHGDSHVRRHRSVARRQRRGLPDYRRFSMTYRSALENNRGRVSKASGVVS